MSGKEHLSFFKDDFEFLRRCKKELIEIISKYQSTSENEAQYRSGSRSYMEDGCKLRTIFPQGGDIARETLELSKTGEYRLYFVGFFGHMWSGASDHVKQRIWDYDEPLVTELANHKDMVLYLSGERSLGGNWGNFVVFRHPRAVDTWRKADIHSTVVQSISAHYYSHLRIHRGVLARGLCSEAFGVERTLFLNYNNEEGTVAERYVINWEEEQEELNQKRTICYSAGPCMTEAISD